jgi:deoxyadenosine/deoxycytidine kinase
VIANPPRILAISGSVGVGKTSLISSLSQHLSEAQIVPENVGENPFLADFYADRKRWAFHSRMSFLAMKVKAYSQIAKGGSLAIIDRSLEELITFATLHYESGLLDKREFDLFCSLHGSILAIAPPLWRVIYLYCSPLASLERIRARARPFEAGIDEKYLQAISAQYDRWLGGISSNRVLRLDTGALDKPTVAQLALTYISATGSD